MVKQSKTQHYPKDITDFLLNYVDTYIGPSAHTAADMDDLGLVLRSHLLAELLMNIILKRNIKNHQTFSRRELTFSMKLFIIDFFRFIPQKLVTALRSLNSIRNRFAHDIRVDLLDVDFDTIVKQYTLPPPKKILWKIRKHYKSKSRWKKFLFRYSMGGFLTELVHITFGWKTPGKK